MRKKILASIFIVLASFISSFLHGAIPAQERAALIAFYNSTNGDGWINKSGWKTPPLHTDGFALPGTEGSWYGVTVSENFVTSIYLHSNQLTGAIPVELGNLSHLQALRLWDNQLNGPLPTELCNLSNLQILHLWSNQLNGTIPVRFGDLSNLHELALWGNQLSGTIPEQLGNLTNLTSLNLTSNRLSGNIPSQLANLINLRYLALDWNNFTGIIPSWIGNFSMLQYLALSKNQFTGGIPTEFGNLSKLTSLYLYRNQLSGTVPEELGNLSELKNLVIGQNQFSGSIPSALGNLSKMKILILGSNQLSGVIPSQFGNFADLEILNLSHNQLSGVIPSSLTNLIQITTLDIGYNCLNTSDPTLRTWLNNNDPDWEAHQDQCGGMPSITVTSPNGGETWAVGSSHAITWTTTGSVGNVKIEYTTNYGSSWTTIISSTTNSGSYTWTVPNTVSSQCKIKISEAAAGIPLDESNSTFTISLGPSITVTSPDGGESWGTGSSHSIKWTTTGTVGNVKIGYSTNNGSSWKNITSSTANDGFYTWTVPNKVSSQCKIKISEASDGIPTDTSDAVFSIVSAAAKISLNRHKLNFCSIISGPTSSQQRVAIKNSGSGTLNWQISVDAPWLICTPDAGTGNGTFFISIKSTGLTLGTYMGKVIVSDPNATNSPQIILVTLKIKSKAQYSEPFGEFSTPVDGSTVRSSIPVTGWVLDDIETQNVKIYREEGDNLVLIGNAVMVEDARPDVENAYPDYPFNYKAGWGYMLLTNFLPNGGNGAFKLHAVATGGDGKTVDLGVKTITVDNAHAVKPFGAIDTPTPGGTASGGSFINWGWVLTPQPNNISIDGSAIGVWIDGVYIGHPVYNNYRQDIASLFPGYANSNGAAGYYYLDTTAYENGIHTIQWTATDSAGKVDGIDSRYFTVQNSGSFGMQSTAEDVANIVNIIDSIPTCFSEPIMFNRDLKTGTELEELLPDEAGLNRIVIKELERIEIKLGENYSNVQGYLMNNNKFNKLPIGSTLDAKSGTFSWAPGPGFLGRYSFIFILTDSNGQVFKKSIEIEIEPKFK